MPVTWSIRHYLLALVLAMALPLCGLLAYSLHTNYAAALYEAGDDLAALADIVAADTRRLVRNSDRFLGALAKRPEVRRLDPEGCDPVLGDVKSLFAEFANVAVLDREGQMLCSALRPGVRDLPSFAGMKWFDEARRHNGFYISQAHLGPVSRKWVVTLSAAIQDEHGAFNGLVGYSLDLASNPLLIASSRPVRHELSVAAVDADGVVVMRLGEAGETIGAMHSRPDALAGVRHHPGKARLIGDDERQVLAAYAPVEGTPWGVVVLLPASEVLNGLWLKANRHYLIAIFLTVLGSLLALYVGRHITRPVQAIARTAAHIARGDFSHRVDSRGPREIVSVAQQFNRMLDIRVKAEERYQNLFESASDGIVVVDEGGRIVLANSQACVTFGYEPGSLVGHSIEDLVPEDERERHARAVADYLVHPERRAIGRFVHGRRRDGASFPCNITLSPLRTADGMIVSAIVRDLTEFTRLEEQLAYLTRHDALTGLPNRSLLRDRLDLALARAHRGGTGIAVVHLDLDRFSQINDFHGIAFGDGLLKSCADAIRACTREFDTVVRTGSDEFVAILEGEDAELLAGTFVERVRARLAALRPAAGATVGTVSASYGVAIYPCEGGSGELLKNADLALAQARREGGDACRYFDHAMDAHARRRAALLAQLHGALERGEFHLVYQPKVETLSGRVAGVEALLRWTHPELGLVSPAEFIPLAEASTLIDSIGAWVIEQACRQGRAWDAAGLPALGIAVNLSARQFRDHAALVAGVGRALAASGLPAERLELEITEGMLMESPEAAIETLNALHVLGIRISIDDFGTGYSSLSYLRRFPVHALKIDQSFVRDLAAHDDDRAIVSAVIALAHTLQLAVVAEGVETEAQRGFLAELGCELCQGYLFARPLPPAGIEALLRPA